LASSFQGILDTGWFPADCALAVGTQRSFRQSIPNVRITNLTNGGASNTTLKDLLGVPAGAIKSPGAAAADEKMTKRKRTYGEEDGGEDEDDDVQGGTLFDPVVHYDHFAGRFVLVSIVTNSANTDGWYSSPSEECHADQPVQQLVCFTTSEMISTEQPIQRLGDLRETRIRQHIFLHQSNQFNSSGAFQYGKIRRYTKSQFYNGQAVSD
jgi:hypothetical protein